MSTGNAPATWDAQHWQRIRAILEKAMALPVSERPAFLQRACADAADRNEVESLLAGAAASAWLDQPAVSPQAHRHAGDAPLLPAGTQLGPYKVEAKLGQGGMGVVYKAVDTRLDRTVALKVLSSARGTHEERTRFLREAKAASALNHPNIVTIYEYDSSGDRDFIAMEFIEGQTLRQILDAATVPLETTLGYAMQVSGGLARAHQAGIVHRDLKPGNIMVTSEGVAKVLDFGLARWGTANEPGADDLTALTRVGTILGTPSYMAPEQAMGAPIDYRADIFSFGIVLYEITCGRLPFKGSNPRATMHQIAAAEPLPVRQVNGTASHRLVELIGLCLSKNPDQRPQAMAEVTGRLQEILGQGPRNAPPPKVSRRHALAGGLVIVTAGLAGLWYTRQPAAAPPLPAKLRYTVEAQQIQDGQPVGEPHITSGADIFDGLWRFRLRAEVLQSGSVYVVDDGPDQSGVYQLAVLSAARLSASQPLETKWFRLEGKPGTERLWIVWSRVPVAELEAIGNRVDKAAAAGIRALLKALALEPGRELRGAADTVGAMVALQHR